MIQCEDQVMFTVSVIVMQPSNLCGRTSKPSWWSLCSV